jgi:hypothetical protein
VFADLDPYTGFVMQNDVKAATLEELIALVHTDSHAADLVGLPMALSLPTFWYVAVSLFKTAHVIVEE